MNWTAILRNASIPDSPGRDAAVAAAREAAALKAAAKTAAATKASASKSTGRGVNR